MLTCLASVMERTDLTYEEWLQHLQEELLDACVYLEKLMELTKYVGISRKIDDRGNFPDPFKTLDRWLP